MPKFSIVMVVIANVLIVKICTFIYTNSLHNDEEPMLVGFVPIMMDQRIGQHKKVAGGISSQFGALRMLPGVRNDIRVAESFAAGQPVRYYAPKSRAAYDYQQLADAATALMEKSGWEKCVRNAGISFIDFILEGQDFTAGNWLR